MTERQLAPINLAFAILNRTTLEELPRVRLDVVEQSSRGSSQQAPSRLHELYESSKLVEVSEQPSFFVTSPGSFSVRCVSADGSTRTTPIIEVTSAMLKLAERCEPTYTFIVSTAHKRKEHPRHVELTVSATQRPDRVVERYILKRLASAHAGASVLGTAESADRRFYVSLSGVYFAEVKLASGATAVSNRVSLTIDWPTVSVRNL